MILLRKRNVSRTQVIVRAQGFCADAHSMKPISRLQNDCVNNFEQLQSPVIISVTHTLLRSYQYSSTIDIDCTLRCVLLLHYHMWSYSSTQASTVGKATMQSTLLTVVFGGNEALTSIRSVIQLAMLGEYGQHRGRSTSEAPAALLGHVLDAN